MTDRHTTPHSYFAEAYRDYRLQNPTHKLSHYLAEVASSAGSGPIRLLDVGCGLGSFLEHVSSTRPDWELYATDIDPIAVSTVQEKLSRVVITQATAEDLAYPEAHFDVITAWDVLEHVNDLDAARAAITRMLRPGGRLLFVVPVYDGPVGWLVRRLDKDPTHVQKRSRWDWLGWPDPSLQVEHWHGIFRYLIGSRYIHVVTRRWRRWSPAVLVSCSRVV